MTTFIIVQRDRTPQQWWDGYYYHHELMWSPDDYVKYWTEVLGVPCKVLWNPPRLPDSGYHGGGL